MSVWKKIATPSSGHLDSAAAAAAAVNQFYSNQKSPNTLGKTLPASNLLLACSPRTLMSVWKKIAAPTSGHRDSTSVAAVTSPTSPPHISHIRS
jgi:hypothetical protein